MKTQVISFRCVLKNRLGQVLSSSVQSDVINCVDHAGDLPGLVSGLQNVKAGERRLIEVKAEQAYGYYDPDLYGEIPRAELKRGGILRVGDTLPLYSPEKRSSMTFRVVSVSSESVALDANHPLAGQDLIFDVEILEARELREEDEAISPVSKKIRELH